MPDSHITANVRASHEDKLQNLSNTFFNEVKWAQVNLHLTTVKVFKDSQLKIPQSGLCLYIGLLVAPATNTVKVISNEVGLRLLCCGMCFTYIHLFEATHHNIKTFQKGFVE